MCLSEHYGVIFSSKKQLIPFISRLPFQRRKFKIFSKILLQKKYFAGINHLASINLKVLILNLAYQIIQTLINPLKIISIKPNQEKIQVVILQNPIKPRKFLKLTLHLYSILLEYPLKKLLEFPQKIKEIITKKMNYFQKFYMPLINQKTPLTKTDYLYI